MTTAIQKSSVQGQAAAYSNEIEKLRSLWRKTSGETLDAYWRTGQSANRILYGFTRDEITGDSSIDQDQATQRYGEHKAENLAAALNLKDKTLYKAIKFFVLVPEVLKDRILASEAALACITVKRMFRIVSAKMVSDEKKLRLLDSAVARSMTGQEFQAMLNRALEAGKNSPAGMTASPIRDLKSTVSFLRSAADRVNLMDQVLARCDKAKDKEQVRQQLESIKKGAETVQKNLGAMLTKINKALK